MAPTAQHHYSPTPRTPLGVPLLVSVVDVGRMSIPFRHLGVIRAGRVRRGFLVLLTMWLLGLVSLGAVLSLESRFDQRRQAQLAVADVRLQLNELPRVALDINHVFTRAEVGAELKGREARIAVPARSLDRLSGNSLDSSLIMARTGPVFALLDRVNTVSSAGRLAEATDALGMSLIPGSPGFELNAALDTMSAAYSQQAREARDFAEFGSVFAIVLVLIAFSVALHRSTRLAREKHDLLEQSREDALTDQLTGLWNRRKLFADLEELLARPSPAETVVLGMFDLDGFKAYNDTFGHPAGDSFLTRLGTRLVTGLGDAGSAYRVGGDEFCAIARGPAAEVRLAQARASLAEQGDEYSICSSVGTLLIEPGRMTPAEVFRKVDQRLYHDKRTSRIDELAPGPETPPADSRRARPRPWLPLPEKRTECLRVSGRKRDRAALRPRLRQRTTPSRPVFVSVGANVNRDHHRSRARPSR